jgi:hypothetical protein
MGIGTPSSAAHVAIGAAMSGGVLILPRRKTFGANLVLRLRLQLGCSRMMSRALQVRQSDVVACSAWLFPAETFLMAGDLARLAIGVWLYGNAN